MMPPTGVVRNGFEQTESSAESHRVRAGHRKVQSRSRPIGTPVQIRKGPKSLYCILPGRFMRTIIPSPQLTAPSLLYRTIGSDIDAGHLRFGRKASQGERGADERHPSLGDLRN